MELYAVLAFVFVVLALMVPTIYAGFIGAPLVFTPKSAIREALRKAGAKEGSRLFELGCGTGRVLLIAEKEFRMNTVGFELSPIIYWIAKLNLKLNGSEKSEVRRLNAYEQDLSQADIVFCFLSVSPMERLKGKFLKELKDDALVVSYSFSVKGWEPVEKITGYPGNVYVYRVGDARK